MQITYIRHAESTNNTILYLNQSQKEYVADPPLSDLGERQAHALGEFLANNLDDFRFDRIYISPSLRTLQTAQAFTSLYPDAPKIVWPGIHEYGGCGVYADPKTGNPIRYPGLKRSEIQTKFPDYQLSEEITEDGWYTLPDFEPRETALARAELVKQTMVALFGNTDMKIAFVSHWDFHILFTNAILGVDGSNHARLGISNTGISNFYYGLDRGDPIPWWTLITVNRCEWLTPEVRRKMSES